MKYWFSKYLRPSLWRRSAIICSVALAGLSNLGAQEQKISGDLLRVLDQSAEPVPVLVIMQPFQPLPLGIMNEARLPDIERMMKSRAVRAQAEMRQWVNDIVSTPTITGDIQLRRYKFFWNLNGFMATVSHDVVAELADREDVSQIFLDRTISLFREVSEEVEPDGAEFTYGLERMKVPELRQEYPALTGAGITVGILDTGIDANHPEFKGRKIVFKDFAGTKTEAYDDNGHGTHVAGTIGGNGVGGTHIGVAPEVNFVIGKIFGSSGRATLSGILRGMEWMLNPDGNPDTDDKPRVVNNSWGGGFNSDIKKDPFNQAVLSWVQLEVFPSFAAGNSGPRASSVGSPGGLPIAFAVGATDSRDSVASFSSRGPVKIVVDGEQEILSKPDVSAPGVEVFSAMPGGTYAKMSGTSMATPHVTGVIALLYQLKPSFKVSDVRDLLMKTADDLGKTGHDYDFGAGRVNALKLVTSALESGLDLEVIEEDWSI